MRQTEDVGRICWLLHQAWRTEVAGRGINLALINYDPLIVRFYFVHARHDEILWIFISSYEMDDPNLRCVTRKAMHS